MNQSRNKKKRRGCCLHDVERCSKNENAKESGKGCRMMEGSRARWSQNIWESADTRQLVKSSLSTCTNLTLTRKAFFFFCARSLYKWCPDKVEFEQPHIRSRLPFLKRQSLPDSPAAQPLCKQQMWNSPSCYIMWLQSCLVFWKHSFFLWFDTLKCSLVI